MKTGLWEQIWAVLIFTYLSIMTFHNDWIRRIVNDVQVWWCLTACAVCRRPRRRTVSGSFGWATGPCPKYRPVAFAPFWAVGPNWGTRSAPIRDATPPSWKVCGPWPSSWNRPRLSVRRPSSACGLPGTSRSMENVKVGPMFSDGSTQRRWKTIE